MMKKKKEYIIECKGFYYVKDSIERKKKELDKLKLRIEQKENEKNR